MATLAEAAQKRLDKLTARRKKIRAPITAIPRGPDADLRRRTGLDRHAPVHLGFVVLRRADWTESL
jgi:hypothetical protein